MNKEIIAIIGPSGAGKDTFAMMLSRHTGYPLIVSFTTRPIRAGEVDGREHHFRKLCRFSKALAYTEYGGYKYWTTPEQVKGTVIYVIDEDGVRYIMDNYPEIKVVKVLLTANKEIRVSRGITKERMRRDWGREMFPIESFEYRVYNNTSLKNLEDKSIDLACRLTSKK